MATRHSKFGQVSSVTLFHLSSKKEQVLLKQITVEKTYMIVGLFLVRK